MLKEIFNKKFFKEDTKKTSDRWIKAMSEFNNFDDFDVDLFTLFKAQSDQNISCKDIEVWSLCSHHLFPYFCKIDITYKPDEHYCGLSKLPRVCEWYSKRPCSQEELVDNIFDFLNKNLKPKYLEVIAHDGMHTCSASRGIKKSCNYNIIRRG